MPRSVRKSQRTIEQAIRRLEQKLMRPPKESEIAEVGVGIEAYQKMLGDARGAQLVHLDDLGDRDSDDEYLERHWQPQQDDPIHSLRDDRFREALIGAIERLPEREQQIMAMYYEQDMNLKEIGAVLGVTESRVSQLHSQAVARLRANLKGWF